MSHRIESVGTSVKGSMKTAFGSGMSSMSDSLIFWKPRMDEPSKPSPSVNISSSSAWAGIEKCCQAPSRSQNLTSTTRASFSRAYSNTSFGVIAYQTSP